MTGTIIVEAVSVLKNRLIIVHPGFAKSYLILPSQWDEIIERDLIGTNVEFDGAHYRIHPGITQDDPIAMIKFPPINYTDEEVKNLMFKTWDKLKPFQYNQPHMQEFNTWWDLIKKKKMIYEQTLEEANEIKSRPDPVWKEIAVKKTRATLRIFQYGEEPEIVYIITSGYTSPQMYHLIFEDGYESPIITQFWNKQQIKENLNIDL